MAGAGAGAEIMDKGGAWALAGAENKLSAPQHCFL